jgi:prophage antirepressor-like protein
MSDILPFNYGDHIVRTILIGGEPWFVLADLCKVLDLSNPSMVADRLNPDDLSTTEVIDSMGRRQQARIVNESGMYETVFMSRKPEAVAFRRWVTSTVLPEIRKTGSFNAQPALTGPELMALALQESQRTIEQREARIYQLDQIITEQAPKVTYVDTYVTDADLLSFSTVASTCGLTEKALRKLLIERDWIYSQQDSRWSERRQQKVTRNRYSEKADKKRYFRRVEVHEAPRFRGSEVMHTLKITPQGAEAIARLVERAA